MIKRSANANLLAILSHECSLVFCAVWVTLVLMSGCGAGNIAAPPSSISSGFQQTNLVSDTAGSATRFDPLLQNPWGLAVQPGLAFWLANNNRGTARVFDSAGNPVLPAGVGIPSAQGNAVPSAPAGVAFNPIPEDFLVKGTPAQLLFASEDGTVSTWSSINGNFPTNAVLAVDDSVSLTLDGPKTGAAYKGLAILTPKCCREYLALADFRRGFIATYSVNFDPLITPGPFKDPNLSLGFAPFNIVQVDDEVFVTYALQDNAETNPVIAPGNGIVNIFDKEGNFVRRFVSNGPLNAPWGIAKASPNFGPFSNNILIGNFGDGTINVFDPATGNFLGPLKDTAGRVITNPGLWALVFGSAGVGDANTLYFTAGSGNEDHGLFGAISPRN
jgi:uncharacterized protein (TIGR03118 family)